MPMSASCVVNRAELLALLEEVRAALPGSLAQAQELIGGREQMVEQARQEAERIIEKAHAERGSLISDTEVARRSQAEADRILAEARQEAEEIRAEADDYVDSKLANFEVVLTKTLGSVGRGREKLLGPAPALDEQGYEDDGRSRAQRTTRRPCAARADEYVDAKLGAFEAVLAKTLEAVGRGRQKLHGRIATDDLGAHWPPRTQRARQHSSDADYLADLAALAEQQPRPAAGPAAGLGPPQPATPAPPATPGRTAYPPSSSPTADAQRLPAAGLRAQQDPYGYQQSRSATRYQPGLRRQQAAYDPNQAAAGYRPSRPSRRTSRSRRRERARRDQPLRHQHDQHRSSCGAYEQGRWPGRSDRIGPTSERSSILALRSRVRPRSRLPGTHRQGGSPPELAQIESRNGPERPPRPPQPPRVRHARAGSAARCAAAPDPHGRRPQGLRYQGSHRSAGRRPRGARTPPRVGHGRGARHRHRPCTGRGGVRKVSGAA